MKAYRKLLADKVLTLGILSIVSLIFGRLIAKEKAVDWSLVLLAFMLFLLCCILSYFLIRRVDDDTS